jgi:hypothetical protein
MTAPKSSPLNTANTWHAQHACYAPSQPHLHEQLQHSRLLRNFLRNQCEAVPRRPRGHSEAYLDICSGKRQPLQRALHQPLRAFSRRRRHRKRVGLGSDGGVEGTWWRCKHLVAMVLLARVPMAMCMPVCMVGLRKWLAMRHHPDRLHTATTTTAHDAGDRLHRIWEPLWELWKTCLLTELDDLRSQQTVWSDVTVPVKTKAERLPQQQQGWW